MDTRSFLKELNENAERWLLLPLYALIVILISIEVGRRFLLSYSSIWAEEVARYAFIYVSWIGASAGIKQRAHIRIDVVLQFLPEKAVAFVYIFGDLVTMALAVMAFYWSMHPVIVSIHFGSVTAGLRISQAWFLAAVPLGFAMMMVRLVQSMKRDVSDIIAGRPVFRGSKLFD